MINFEEISSPASRIFDALITSFRQSLKADFPTFAA